MELKDVAHFYLNTSVKWRLFASPKWKPKLVGTGRLVAVRPETEGAPMGFLATEIYGSRQTMVWRDYGYQAKPILRRLETIGELQGRVLFENQCSLIRLNLNEAHRGKAAFPRIMEASGMMAMLMEGFDIFGLIPARIAIDASTLEPRANDEQF